MWRSLIFSVSFRAITQGFFGIRMGAAFTAETLKSQFDSTPFRHRATLVTGPRSVAWIYFPDKYFFFS